MKLGWDYRLDWWVHKFHLADTAFGRRICEWFERRLGD